MASCWEPALIVENLCVKQSIPHKKWRNFWSWWDVSFTVRWSSADDWQRLLPRKNSGRTFHRFPPATSYAVSTHFWIVSQCSREDPQEGKIDRKWSHPLLLSKASFKEGFGNLWNSPIKLRNVILSLQSYPQRFYKVNRILQMLAINLWILGCLNFQGPPPAIQEAF